MSDSKQDKQTRKKLRGRALPRTDVIREPVVDDSPMSQSLDSLLTVRKAPFVPKNKSFAGSSSRRPCTSTNLLAESSSNDSFSSAKSALCGSERDGMQLKPDSIVETEVPSTTNFPSENVLVESDTFADTTKYQTAEESSSKLTFDSTIMSCPSPTQIIPDPNDTDETLRSYEEEIVHVETRMPSQNEAVLYCDHLEKEIVSDILQRAVEEETLDCPDVEEPEDLCEMISSAAASQAFMEALSEDSDTQIKTLSKMREEELKINISLRTRVLELENMKGAIDNIVAEMECNYAETYSELSATHEKELEVQKLEAIQKSLLLENEIKDLTGKLIVAESKIAANEELEADLHDRVQSLEDSLREKEVHCKEELEGVIAKSLQLEIVSEAKNEVEQEMTNIDQDRSRSGSQVADNNLSLVSRALSSETLLAAEREVDQEMNTAEFDRAAMVADFRRASLLETAVEDISSDNFTRLSPEKRPKRGVNSKAPKNMCKEDSTTLNLLKSQLKANVLELNALREENEALKLFKLQMEDESESQRLKEDSIKEERDKLIEEKQLWEVERRVAEEAKTTVAHLGVVKANLEQEIEELNHKIAQISCERDSLLMKRLSMDTTLLELQNEKDALLSKNRELQEIASKSLEEAEARQSLETELEKLRLDFRQSGSLNQSLEAEVSIVRKEFEQLRGDWSSAKTRADRLESEMTQLNWSSRVSEATQYLEYLPVHSSAGLSQAEAAVQTDGELDGPVAPLCSTCKPRAANQARQESLEKDLETSWTERCEVEQHLAAALAENSVLRQRTKQVEAASRRVAGLMDSGVPSVAIWLQLRSCVKEIVAELAVLRATQTGSGFEGADEANENSLPIHSVFLPNGEPRSAIGVRSSPEGGRESPRLTDGGIANDGSENGTESEDGPIEELIQTQDLFHDQSSNALLDMVQELLRCLGGEDINGDLSCSLNGSLNTTLNERLSALPDAEELCRCLQQVKEEVTRLFALSRRTDPAVARLQEQVCSLEQQVIASDKQVRSTRAFLEEQAAERELERDEAAVQINQLSELLRTRERQLANKANLEQDFETLEVQLSEAQSAVEAENEKRIASELKLEQSLQKVWTLREILEVLEAQVAEGSEQLQAAKEENSRLQERLLQLGQLSLERENAQRDSFSDTLTYVARLEEEVTSLRRLVEATGPESLAFARSALKELESAVAKRTRELELVQVAWNGGRSSASEEISTRDHADATRCPTPDEMALEAGAELCEDVERLKERLMKHARVEEAALKRIKELEYAAAKSEELQVDLEVAMRRIDSLLTENETNKAKLESERHRAQENLVSADLQKRIRQLESDLGMTVEALGMKERLLMEKSRREERLQESLDAREVELRQEALAMKEALDLIKAEKVKRLAAESRLDELSRSDDNETGLEQPMAKRINNSNNFKSNNNSSSFSNSSKRVKFCVPESFVGESITPISPSHPSILRNNMSAHQDWSAQEQISRKPMQWESISSVAALQLSPRGAFPHSSNAFSSLPEDSVPVVFSSSVKKLTNHKATATANLEVEDIAESEELGQEVASLQWQLKEAKDLLGSLEGDYKQQILNLEAELTECRSQITFTNEQMNKVKKDFDVTLSQVKLQSEQKQSKLEEEKTELESLAIRLQELSAESKVEKDRTLQEIQSQLKKQKEATCALEEALKRALEELESVKSEREELVSEDRKRLGKVLVQLELQQEETISLKQQQRSICEELSNLKTERDLLLGKEGELTAKIEELSALRQLLVVKDSVINNLRKEVTEKERVESAKESSEILVQRIEKLEKVHEKELIEVRLQMESEKVAHRLAAEECNRLKEVKMKLENMLHEAKEHLEAAYQSQQNTSVSDCDRSTNQLNSSDSRYEKLCVGAAGRISELRECLESSLLRVESLEAELVIVRTCLETSESKAETWLCELNMARQTIQQLTQELEAMKHKADGLSSQLVRLQARDSDCGMSRQAGNSSSGRLEKIELKLAMSQRRELKVRKALESAVDLGREAAARECCLKEKLAAAEREVLHLRYLVDTQDVNVRGLKRLHQHAMAVPRLMQAGADSGDQRAVRSAGDGQARPTDTQWTVQRLESYRKALVWQKHFLQRQRPGVAGSRAPGATSRWGRARRPTLRVVAFMAVALVRMRFLVCRWRSRLPPLISPPRYGRERPLMLTTPPCKDPGFQPNRIK